MTPQKIYTVVTGGPSSYMDRAAVIIFFDFEGSFGEVKPVLFSSFSDIEKIIPTELYDRIDQNRLYKNAAELVTDLANAIQCCRYKMPFKSASGVDYEGKFYIAVSYYSFQAAMSALNFSLSLIKLFASRMPIALETVQHEFEVQLKYQKQVQPVHTSVSMLNAALAMKVPVYQVLDGSRIFCYGQGENSLLFKSLFNSLGVKLSIAPDGGIPTFQNP